MNEGDLRCREESGGGIEDGGTSNCKDMDWAQKYCAEAKTINGCKGNNKSFYEEYCPKTCEKCWLT